VLGKTGAAKTPVDETMTNRDPIKTIDDATVWYLDDVRADKATRSENVKVDIYPNWIVLRDVGPTWIPRDMVEKVSQL
jgi:hypothetical protein